MGTYYLYTNLYQYMKKYPIMSKSCSDVTQSKNTSNGSRYEDGFGLVEMLLCSSFQRYMTHIPKNSFYKFRKLGHVTDDIIMGSRDQNWSKSFIPKFSQINFRKSHGGIILFYVPFLSGVRRYHRPGQVGLKWLRVTRNSVKFQF